MPGICREGDVLVDDSGGGGSGGVVSISDGANPLIKATVFDYPSSDPLATQLVDLNGDPITSFGGTKAPTSSVTSVAATTSNANLLVTNTLRQGASIFNHSTLANAFVKLGSTCSTTSFTVLIPPMGFYEIPVPLYTGPIDGIWDTVSGSARITELT